MPERVEFQPSDDEMVIWDGTILEVFAGSVSGRFHIKGIADIEVSEGFGRNIMIKNRFGSDVGISYDKERLAEVREFFDQVRTAAQSAG